MCPKLHISVVCMFSRGACLLVLFSAIPLFATESSNSILLNPILGNDISTMIQFDRKIRAKMSSNIIHPRNYDISVIASLKEERRSSQRRLVLIRVSNKDRSRIKQKIEDVLGMKMYRYVPPDTYMAEANEIEISNLRKIEGVINVIDVPSVIKVSDAILEEFQSASPLSIRQRVVDQTFGGCSGLESSRCKRYSVQLSRIDANAFLEGIAHVMNELKNVALLRPARRTSAFVLLEVCQEYSLQVVNWMSSLHEVKWIGPFSERRLRAMKETLDPNEKSSTSLRNVFVVEQILGLPRSIIGSLSGKGQLVAVTDTGIDYAHCFFYDPDHGVDVCDESETTICQSQSSNNRKIVSYTVMPGAADGDFIDGHGTHVCGIVAGNANGQPNSEFVTKENGVAPDAKIVFQDGGRSQASDSLSIPPDIQTYLFSTAYGQGARVHSNSWGGNENHYTMDTQQTDEFIYMNPDYIMIFAAGNDGPYLGTVTDPAVAKNIISVGASQGLPENSLDYQFSSPVLVLSTETTEQIFVASALFGSPIYRTFRVRGSVVLAQPEDACRQLQNPEQYSGKFVLVRRGSCTFSQKSFFVQNASALGMVVYNNNSSYPQRIITMMPADSFEPDIPCMMISLSDGTMLKGMIEKADQTTFIEIPAITDLVRDVADFSSRGPTYDGRLKPDLLAPGYHVVSARSNGQLNQTYCGLDALIAMSGTSMATPAVAGAALLLREYFTSGLSPGNGLSPPQSLSRSFDPSAALVKAMLLHSSRHVGSESGFLTPSFDQGYGLINLSSVIVTNERNVLRVQDGINISNNELITFCADVGGSTDLRVTIAWTDPPAYPSAVLALINDLDLTILGPNGETKYGNGKQFQDSAYGKYNVRDRKNNNEQVVWSEPGKGTYTLFVSGRDVPLDPQPFSIVISGDFELKDSCPPPSCPQDCNQAGSCRGVYCHCDLYHFGDACELSMNRLDPGIASWVDLEADARTLLYFNMSAINSTWRLIVEPMYTYNTFSLMLAVNRKPSLANNDLLLRGVKGETEIASSSFSFNTQGVWVLAIQTSPLTALSFALQLEVQESSSEFPGVTSSTTSSTPSPPSPPSSTQTPSVFEVVTFQAQMSITQTEFLGIQSRFLLAVAKTAGVSQQDVKIVAVKEVQASALPPSRRLMSTSSAVVIKTSITCAGVSSANQVVSRIDSNRLNTNLEQQGIPRAVIIQAPFVDTSSGSSSPISTSPPPSSQNAWSVWIAVGCGAAFLSLVILAVIVHMRRKRAAEETFAVINTARSHPGDVEMQSYGTAATRGIITMPTPTAPPLLAVNADNVYIEERERERSDAVAAAEGGHRRFHPFAMAAGSDDADSCKKGRQ
mmetsp:Transcript_35916/g.80880  ORF Transcript_35916/g.80880 Transcript_35916/m.80880 type:complete len:1352 (-) Transcript_35916:140-4195(-)